MKLGQESLFDNRQTGFEVFLFLQECIREQKPVSLIRLGDGEGAVSGYPEITGRKEVNRSWNNWIGDTNVSEEDLLKLSINLREAISNADVIGLPRKKQAQSFYLYQAVFDVLEHYDLLNSKHMITDAAIHRYLQFALLYRAIFKNLDFLGVISSRSVEAEIKSVFGVKKTRFYRVRGQSAFPGKEEVRHYPNGYKALYDILEVPYKGAVFIVGAGAFGKIYCQWIKERGGIALDIGSIFEPWAKVPSRTVHPCHHMEVYDELPYISREHAIERYNHLCDHFGMDTAYVDLDSESVSNLPADW